jgi:hypothetical protein
MFLLEQWTDFMNFITVILVIHVYIYTVLILSLLIFYSNLMNFIDAATFFLEDDAEEANEEAKTDFNNLKDCVNNLLGEWRITNYPEHLDNHIHEM